MCKIKKKLREREQHRKSKTTIYAKWKRMRRKCNNPLHHSYKSYGGEGIKVCQEWNNSFEAFYDWSISHGYSNDLRIDRIDKNGDFSPQNCKWVTRSEIEAKKRKNFAKIAGINKPIKDWTDFMDWDYPKHQMRFYRGKEVFNADEIKEIEEKLKKWGKE